MKIAASVGAADSRIIRALRVCAWNVLILGAALVVAAVAGEAWLRLGGIVGSHRLPFMTSSLPSVFVPGVGFVRKPNTDMRYTNGKDFWTVQRSNSLGFLDREPPTGRADAGCRVVVIGDSNVEAREVEIKDKLHVRMEEIAATKLPRLNLSASAFGRGATGQVQQLAFYDHYARFLRPDLVVLVFVPNDFMDNSPVLSALLSGWDPARLPAPSVVTDADGKMRLRPPHPDYVLFGLRGPTPPRPLLLSLAASARDASWLVGWIEDIADVHLRPRHVTSFVRRAEALRRRPGYAASFAGWEPTRRRDLRALFAAADPPPVVREALEYTTFALEQFKTRTDRDGARLVALLSHRLTVVEPSLLQRASQLAAAAGIPVIDQADYIRRQGAKLEDAEWPHDTHWNVAGHQWAAEALIEYLEQRPEACVGSRDDG